MKAYTIYYNFDGYGEVNIEANSEEEARQKFYDGEYTLSSDNESGQNYEVSTIKQIK